MLLDNKFYICFLFLNMLHDCKLVSYILYFQMIIVHDLGWI